MIKKIFKILAFLLLLSYLVASFVLWNNESEKQVCQHFYITVRDSVENKLITAQGLYQYLDEHELIPRGRVCGEVSPMAIEQCVEKIDLLTDIECYYEDDGDVYLYVSQRRPVMRVITEYGGNYYLDAEGERIEPSALYVDYVPLVTGYVDEVISVQELKPIVEYIAHHDFWRNQVTQIYISPQHEIMIYPRVGEHIIVLGDANEYERKLNSVLTIYNKVIPDVGWNAYDTISVKYDDQVVCTRRDKKYRHKTWTKKL